MLYWSSNMGYTTYLHNRLMCGRGALLAKWGSLLLCIPTTSRSRCTVKLLLPSSAVSMTRISAGVDQLAIGHSSNALYRSPPLSVYAPGMIYVPALIWKQRARRNSCRYLEVLFSVQTTLEVNFNVSKFCQWPQLLKLKCLSKGTYFKAGFVQISQSSCWKLGFISLKCPCCP